MLHRRLFALALASLFLAPSASFAASATQDGYGDDGDVVVQDDTDTGSNDDTTPAPADTADAAPATASGSSNLPFTGLEAGLIAAAGLGLAGTGMALRRAAREQ